MSTRSLFAVSCLYALFSGPAFAQDDPFGRGADDPFAPSGKVAPAKRAAPQAPVRPRTRAEVAQPAGADVEERLQASLSAKTSQAFDDTPLDEALQAIAHSHDIPIVLDRRALEDVGLAPDTPVSLSLEDISLRAFLRLMLRELGLTYMIKDEVLQITTVEVADNNLVLRMHVFPKSLIGKSDQILDALQATVQPDTWDTVGGPSTVVVIENIIAVSANAFVHDQVDEFLVRLDAAYRRSKDAKQ